ncbi:unnamed protein product, partial [Symbiodinium sp. KB8]
MLRVARLLGDKQADAPPFAVIREDSDVHPEGLPDVLLKSDATEIEPDTFSELDRYDV